MIKNLILKLVFTPIFLFVQRITYCDPEVMTNYTLINGVIKKYPEEEISEYRKRNFYSSIKGTIATCKYVFDDNKGKKIWLRKFPEYKNELHSGYIRMRLLVEKVK